MRSWSVAISPAGLGWALFLLALTSVLAALAARLIALPLLSGLLALSPGGNAEMNLPALSLTADIATVAFCHAMRIRAVTLTAPLIAGLVDDDTS